MLPWDYHSELTEERLVKVAQLLQRGRGDAVDRHDPTIGDNGWTLGGRAYRCGCFQITEAAGTPGYEWLDVIDPGQHFQFSVGGVPMRFWRGDPFNPNTRTVLATRHEQLRLDLEPDKPIAGVLLRIGVVTDAEGDFLGASFVALRDEEPETVWPLPLDRADPVIVSLDEDRPEGRELPPPPVGDHPANDDEVADDDQDDDAGQANAPGDD